jgi:ABC-type antimicrobial peptide transport system permease subunit
MTQNKGYTFINIIGFAIGVASSLAVLLWVLDEISYDRFHENASSTYMCYRKVIWNDEVNFSEVTSTPIGPYAKDHIPGIADYARFRQSLSKLEYGPNSITVTGLHTDPSFLAIFSFSLVRGDADVVLSAPNSIVLTQKAATGLFGDQDPMGKTLKNGLVVTGIVENVPENSSIEFDFLIPLTLESRADPADEAAWWSFRYNTFFTLGENVNPDEIGQQIKNIYSGIDPESNIELYLQPLRDVHLRGLEGTGRIVYVYIFSLAAFLLLIIACINFVNLTTARSSKKAKEIGLRKTVGAHRSQLIFQIFTETAIHTFMAVVIAICLLEISLPLLSNFFGKRLVLQPSGDIIFMFLAIIVFTCIAAGSYPAIALSSFRPLVVLKSNKSGSCHTGAKMIRKSLIVFQIVVSAALIFSSLVIYRQMKLINNKNLGINKENIVCIRAQGLDKDYEIFKRELLNYPGIERVSAVYEPPAWCGWHMTGFDFEGNTEDKLVSTGVAWVDYDYIDLFGLKLVSGRDFSRQYSTDETEAYIVNEAAARAMQMDSPIGKSIGTDERPGKIIGVVKDFHFSSLHNKIGPLLIAIDKSNFKRLCIKISPDNIAGSLDHIKRVWQELRSGEKFRYWFFEDLLGREYRVETRTGGIVLSFTIITVFVACLGLFGLAAYSAEIRTKEIGIRKVLGSSAARIVGLLSKDFIFLTIFGNIIALPVAYYITGRWLENFAYRTEMDLKLILFTVGLGIIITIMVVSYQAIRAAQSNPIDALKYE